jgi:hypothetical protein
MVTEAAVAGVLWEVWDPLQVRGLSSASDEYDDYAPEICDLLNTGASAAELASLLNQIYAGTIGGGKLPAPIKESDVAATALVALRERSSEASGEAIV